MAGLPLMADLARVCDVCLPFEAFPLIAIEIAITSAGIRSIDD
jgi:hypothetical protein